MNFSMKDGDSKGEANIKDRRKGRLIGRQLSSSELSQLLLFSETNMVMIPRRNVNCYQDAGFF